MRCFGVDGPAFGSGLNEDERQATVRIAELTAYAIHVPLRREIAHASAARRSSSNLVIRCLLRDGTEGWGEGVPREYVTGETVDGALQQLAATDLAQQLDGDCLDWDDVLRGCDEFRPAPMRADPRGCYGNALRCAVELSILDAYGRLLGQPVSCITQQFQPARAILASHTQVRYSGAITSELPQRERISALKMRLYGFSQCKVKVGVAGQDDPQRLRRIRRWIGRRVDLRVDANEAWAADDAALKIEPLLEQCITAVEQPVPHQHVSALAELRKKIPVPVMLDESLTSAIDAEEAIRQETCDLFNIRLSKCGGFLASLRLAAVAHEAGLGYQLGCHPGETGILSAAGRHWASSVSGIRYLEGSYDRHILKEPLTVEDMTFGYGGRAAALTRPGLGITVDTRALRRMTFQQRTFPVT